MELALSFTVSDLGYKFQMIFLWGTKIGQKSYAGCTYGHTDIGKT